jgi:uncharacterized membrane protein YphA (DoxX/SURF4 family)
LKAWSAWVALWDQREHPLSLALVRLLMAATLLSDLLQVLRLDLVVDLFGASEAGGLGDPMARESPPLLLQLLPPDASTAWLAFSLALLTTFTLLLGLFSRASALVLTLTLAQLALILPPADRGIDMLVRNVLLVLALSGSGEALSIDAWRKTGSVWGRPDLRVSAWPRFLLFAQLVILYFAAGVSKVASAWLPVGGWTALYIAMRDPAFARVPDAWVDALFPLTQLGTFATWLWEWCAPLMLLAAWYRRTPDRPGRLRATFNRLHFLEVYLIVGAVFHLGTHLTLQLGIFPFAVLSLYPAAFPPEQWQRWAGRLRKLRGPAGPTGAEAASRGRMAPAGPPHTTPDREPR